LLFGASVLDFPFAPKSGKYAVLSNDSSGEPSNKKEA
jgi:hypothetical protein